jgi:hypothetical protein
MIRVYLSPISLLSFTHSLSSSLHLSLSLSLFTSAFLDPSDSLPPFFLSVSTLRVRPESVNEDLMFLRARFARPEPAKT